ncbi:FAD/NAD(P)-binding domain-containing protein [Tothia fuscella]|uniref:FAD/NAD(P)-binding domain-containing protein n=1 Tax=Tothia fuscella TaxID=1048955 RepID=A0A9P4U2G4_9PEZI|nr:FAD/NAD(P)-binding domain-containing protein [Tothia fuscella]
MSNRIHKVGGYHKDGYTYYPVVIIGAGESGIAAACQLKEKLGFDQFRIFERQSGIGGTWWINRYPGVACDVPAVFYSFSFAPNPRWTTFYPPGPEIVEYLQDVSDQYGVTDKIELNTDVSHCRWLEEEEQWEITLHHLRPGVGDLSSKDRAKKAKEEGEENVWISKEILRAKVVISAVGGLVEPRAAPEDIPGFDRFEGDCFHSARWNHDVNFKDKDVVVVGSGCSAAQFVPKLVKEPYNAKSVTQLMRSPPWVAPRIPTPLGENNWATYSPLIFTYVPGVQKLLREVVAAGGEWDWRLFGDSAFNENERKKEEKRLLSHMKKTVPEKYHEIMTPDYGVGCKRRIFDAVWLKTLSNPKIDITTMPLTEVHERSVTVGPGQTYPKTSSNTSPEKKEVPADIIVLANGFDVTRWLHPIEVRGKDGKDLVEEMQERGGPQAYQGTAMDGFPNFFIIYGPNTTTGHSSVILATENMVKYALNFIKPILNGDATTVEVKKEAEIAYTTDIQKQLKNTVWMNGGCASWYYDKSGWNSTVLPYGQIWFWYRCTYVYWRDWNIRYTTKGLIKRTLKSTLKLLAIVAVLLGVLRARQSGFNILDFLKNLPRMLNKDNARMGALLAIDKTTKVLKNRRARLLASFQ